MKRLVVNLVAYLAVASSANLASAAFHFWDISEVYTNSSGSVQFIELFTNSGGQTAVNGTQIKSNSKTFTFDHNIIPPPDTGGRHLLIATPLFASLSGVTPDYELPVNFFSSTGDHIQYLGAAGNVTFASAPTSGVLSLHFPGGSSADNSPQNLLNVSGAVNVPPPSGDYNINHTVDAADYTLWRDTFGKTVPGTSGADGNGNGKIDDADYSFWKNHFNNPAGAGGGGIQGGVPEPATTVLAWLAVWAFGLRIAGRGSRGNL